MTTLNTAFESKLASEDKGYKSSSENFNIPTPLWKTSRIHHVSSVENASFNPILVTPCSTRDPWLRPVCRRLKYSSLGDDDTIEDKVPSPFNTSQMLLLQIPRHQVRLLIWLPITLLCDNDNPFSPLISKFLTTIQKTMLTWSCFHVVLTFDNPDRSQACPDTLY